MASYTDSSSGIVFPNVKDSGEITGGSPIGNGFTGVDEFGGIINAVDIDWNSANLANAISTLSLPSNDNLSVSSIYTSGDLVKAMAEMKKQTQEKDIHEESQRKWYFIEYL
ncbi:MAG: hypothetical protein IKP91_00825 [Bacteroidaceae bacterium]|nr:hypothetical protein [Bacteroidaceae bacterium]